MTLLDRLPDLSDAELANLQANARRLSSEGGTRSDAAAELLPALDAEIAARKATKAEAKKERAAAAPPRTRKKTV